MNAKPKILIVDDDLDSGEALFDVELKKNETRYRQIVKAITDYIFTVRIENGQAVETVHGPACAAVTGYSAEEFQANPQLWIQMVPENDRRPVLEQVARILAHGLPEPLEHRILRKDGVLRWVRNTPVLHYDDQGRLGSYDGLIQDITERKRTEEKHASLLHLLISIQKMQVDYNSMTPARELFASILQNLLDFTESEDGFIGEVLYNKTNVRDLRIHAIVTVASNKNTRRFFEEHAADISEFRDLDSLRRRVMATREPVIDNDPADDPRATPVPAEHSSQRCYLGVPLFSGNQFVGVVGLANRPGGFDQKLLNCLQPLLRTAGNIVEVYQNAVRHRQDMEDLRKSNRMYKLLSGCNQFLLRASNEWNFLHGICRTLVAVGEYQSAWVGFSEGGADEILRPVASAGFEAGYLESLNITWADSEPGRGPIGTAIRTGRTCIVNESPHDSNEAAWREEAVRRDYGSMIALPLSINGQPLGALNIYAKKPDAFDAGEVKLLEELAADLAYGIASYRARVHLAQTVNDLREAEQSLRTSQQMLQMVFNSIPVSVFWKDREAIYLGCNQHFAEDVNLNSPQDIIGKTDFDLSWSQRAEFRRADDRQVMDSGVSNIQCEEALTAPDGAVHWLSASKVPFRDADGNIVGVLGCYEDITEKKKCSEEITKLASLVEQSADFIVLATPEGKLTYLNLAGRMLMGIDSSIEVRETRIFDYIMEEDLGRFKNKVLPELLEKSHWQGEFHLKHLKTGRPIVCDLTAFQITQPGMTDRPIALAMIGRDITNRKSLETQLRQAQKMEAIGQLAGGIAHDFNNLLQPILGYTELLLRKFSAEHQCVNDLEHIKIATERAADLNRQLLAFSRQQVLEYRDIDLNQLVGNFLKIIQRIIPEDIVVEFLPGDSPETVHADSGQIEQVLMNLCINARDAMPDGGRLTIETKNALVDDIDLATRPWMQKGSYVLLRVADTGCGMDETTQSHIYEPFFTTKEAGKGTGLGLAMAYGIVKQHNGYIYVTSRPSEGSVFWIYLPSIERKPEATRMETEFSAPGGTETILVAEDAELVRELAVRILEQAGYTVLTAKDGEEAVQVFEFNAERIAIVMLDLIMPQIGGTEAYRRIRSLKPEIPIIFATGYKSMDDELVLGGNEKLLHKPYSPDALLCQIRAMLNANPNKTG